MKKFGLSECELIKFEIMMTFESALDNKFDQIIKTACDEWERRFAEKDPSDACVNVRITGVDAPLQAETARGSGFVKAPKHSQPQRKSKLSVRRFAH